MENCHTTAFLAFVLTRLRKNIRNLSVHTTESYPSLGDSEAKEVGSWNPVKYIQSRVLGTTCLACCIQYTRITSSNTRVTLESSVDRTDFTSNVGDYSFFFYLKHSFINLFYHSGSYFEINLVFLFLKKD